MNAITGAEAAVRMLQAHGVRHLFGLCGDTSLPFYDALCRLDHGIQHVLTRDERSAAYMADAYARITGRPGICEGPSGGGATYILPGVVEANESAIALLSITSDIPVGGRGHYALTELDQKALFAPLTKWNAVADRVDQIPHLFRTAFRAITTGRPGSAHIGLPYDLQKQNLDPALIWAQAEHARFPAFRSGPDPDSIMAAADALVKAKAPFFVCGGGVMISGAQRALRELAELLDAAVASTISGHGVIPDNHPLAVGVVGTNGGTPETRAALEEADLVVFIGCRAGSTSTEHGKVPGHAVPIIHIDCDPMVAGANYRYEAALIGDARLCLEALVRELSSRSAPRVSGIRNRLQELKSAKRERFELLARSNDFPIRPERVIATLQRYLPEDGIITADPGTPCPYFAGHFEITDDTTRIITNRAQGALGYALSAAIGAWYGRPDSKVVAVMGDGSFGFTVGELETIVRKRVPLTMIIISNASYGWIKASQKTGYGERYFSVDFDRTDHALVAEAYGIKSWTVRDPAELDGVIRKALSFGGPSLIDVITQPLEQSNVPVSQWMG